MLGAVAWLLTGLAGLLWVLVTVLLLGEAAALTVVGSAGRARAIATVVP